MFDFTVKREQKGHHTTKHLGTSPKIIPKCILMYSLTLIYFRFSDNVCSLFYCRDHSQPCIKVLMTKGSETVDLVFSGFVEN